MSDGPLDFEIALRDINMDSMLARLERRLLSFSQTAITAGSQVDQALNRIFQNNQLGSQLDLAERKLLGFGTTGVQQVGLLENAFSNLGKLAAGAFVFNQLSDLPQQLIRVRGEMEALEIGLTTILRSKPAADKLVADSIKYAAESPFSNQDVATGAKQLLAYGVAAGDIIPTIKHLGDISAGLSLPLERLTYLYGTTKTQGRLFAQDLNQFVGSGIPLIQELAKQFGVAEDQVRGLVEEGKVGFPQVKKAIVSLTTGGGLFAGTVQAQSKSINALTEQLTSAYRAALNQIGKDNQDLITGIITSSTGAVENYREFIKVLELLVVSYGAYKAASIATVVFKEQEVVAQRLASVEQLRNTAITEEQAIAQAKAAATGSAFTLSMERMALATAQASRTQVANAVAVAESQAAQAASTTLLGRAQTALNSALSFSPYAVVATAVIGLISYLYIFRDQTEAIKTSQQLLSEASKENATNLNQQSAAVKSQIGVLQDQNVAESERLKAYQKLNDISPDILKGLDFQNAKTANLTKTLQEYIATLEKKIRLEGSQGALKQAITQDSDAAVKEAEAQKKYLQAAERAKLTKNLPNLVTGPDARAGMSANQRDLIDARVALNEATTLRIQTQKVVADAEKSVNDIYRQGTKEALQAQIAAKKQLIDSFPEGDKLSLAYKKAEDDLKAYQKQLDAVNQKQKEGKSFAQELAAAQTTADLKRLASAADTDAKLEDLQKKVKEKAKNAVRGSDDKNDLTALDKQLDQLQGKLTKAQKTQLNVGPLGSLSYYENVIKKTDEALSKTKSTDTSAIQKLQTAKAEAEQKVAQIKTLLETPAGSVKYFEGIVSAAQAALEKTPVVNTAMVEKLKQVIVDNQTQAEDARLKIVVRSQAEELQYKKSQYELLARIAEKYGQDSADRQFADLKKSGDSYLDYLNTQINELESKQAAGNLTPQDKTSLGSLLTERDDLKGEKSKVDQYSESLQKAQADAVSLGDYLNVLIARNAELAKTKPYSKDDFDIRKLVADQIVQVQQQQRDALKQYLQDVEGSEQQRTAIQKKYDDLRAELEKQYQNKIKGSAYAQANASINKGEEEALKEVNEQATQASAAYKKLNEVIQSSGRAALKQRLVDLNDYLEKEKDAVNTQAYQAKLKERNDTKKAISDDDLAKVQAYGQTLGQLGEAFTQAGGSGAVFGSVLTGISSNLSLFNDAFKAFQDGDTGNKVQVILQASVNLISMLVDASAKRKAADEAYYKAVIAQQEQYNLLLNEQIGLRSKNNENIFSTDIQGELTDAFDKYDDARKHYDESLGKLNQGLAKYGEKSVIDLGNVAKGLVNGASAGTAILPGVGTVVGAAIGAIAGLFSKKTEDEFGPLLEKYPKLIQQSKDGVDELNTSLAQTLIDQNLVDDATKGLIQSTIDWQKQMDEARQTIKDISKDLVGQLGNNLKDALVNAFKEGTDAAKAFQGVLEDVIESFVTNLLFSQSFKKAFDQLQKDITASLDTANGGDGRIDDDLARNLPDLKAAKDTYLTGLKQYEDFAKANGFNILQNKTAATANAPTGSIQGVTENTATQLYGQILAIRTNQANDGQIIRQQLLMLSGIKANTDPIPDYLPYLRTIDRKLQQLNDGVAGRGWGGNQ